MESKEQTIGIKFLALSVLLIGILDLAVGIMFVLFGFLGKNNFPEYAFLNNFILVFGLTILIIGTIKLIGAYGILKIKRWAWYLTLYSAILIALADLLIFFLNTTRPIIFFVINGLVIWCLLRRKTRNIFFSVR